MNAKAKIKPESSADLARFRDNLQLKLSRLAAEALEAWPTCENRRCHRLRRCASPHRECLVKWRESRPPVSPEETRAGMDELRMELNIRLRLGENATAEQVVDAVEKEKAARRAAMPQQYGDTAAPVVEGTQLAPQPQAQIGRASNDAVASPPAEQNNARERRPRLTQL